jgi:dephospho-CoA kinase
MLKIGITGGMGSGKSLIIKLFKLLDTPVFMADNEAKRLMLTDESLKKDIKNLLGKESYLDNDTVLNRVYIASQVFNNEDKLRSLNALVHPKVHQAFDIWADKQIGKRYVLYESALFFENGSYKSNDINVLVTAPLDIRIGRVMKRDNISQAQIMERIKHQFSDEEKITLADEVIINDGKTAVIPQVYALHKKFL